MKTARPAGSLALEETVESAPGARRAVASAAGGELAQVRRRDGVQRQERDGGVVRWQAVRADVVARRGHGGQEQKCAEEQAHGHGEHFVLLVLFFGFGKGGGIFVRYFNEKVSYLQGLRCVETRN